MTQKQQAKLTPQSDAQPSLTLLFNYSLTVKIQDKPCLIGREKDPSNPNSQFLDANEVSRRHAEIFLQDKHYYLTDLKSSYGTWFKIPYDKPYVIKTKTFFEVGQCEFCIDLTNFNKTYTYEVLWGAGQKKNNVKNESLIVSIGKSNENWLCINDNQFLSKIHCKIAFTDGKLYLVDCKSSNGTWVRVEPHKPFILEEGVEMRLGNMNQIFKVLSIFEGYCDAGQKCNGCTSREVNTVIQPCGHVVLCSVCAKSLGICPKCKSVINKIILTS